jgi:hypothetical protein
MLSTTHSYQHPYVMTLNEEDYGAVESHHETQLSTLYSNG